MRRTQPLADVDEQQLRASDEFDKLWEQNQISGWEDDAPKKTGGGDGIWCSACTLCARMTCHILIHIILPGQKSYSKQTVYDAHLKSKKHLKASARSDAVASAQTSDPSASSLKEASSSSKPSGKYYTPAHLTALLRPLLQSLHPTILETKSNVERRFSLTARERELELEAAEQTPIGPPVNGAPVEEEEEEEKIYNPLKLPLGWDGKPIPYWLFKLHGLGVEYRCEICSDGVYMGR